MKKLILQAVCLGSKFAKKLADLTACLLIFGLAGCEPNPPPQAKVNTPEAKSPTELNRAIYSAYLQLDPQFVKAVADAAPVRDLLVGLMAFNPQGEVVPAIAKEFFSEDGKNWLIVLDENARWSNGEPVMAQDFVASWQRLADPLNASPLAYYLTYMSIKNAKQIIENEYPIDQLGVTALNQHSLKIELHSVNYQLPKMLAHIALLPTYQGKKPMPNEPFISNGSYQIQQQGKMNLILKANSAETAFQTVYYQLISSIQNPDRFDIIENPLANYHRNETELPRLCTYFYEFNFNDPNLSKREVRQAIRAMISPSEISRDFGIPNHLVLPKTMTREISRRLPTASVEQILRPLGIDAQNPLRLTLTHENQGPHSCVGNRIARTLGQSDLFRIEQQAVDWKQLLAKRESKEFQLIRSGWCVDYDDPVVFLLPFHSTNPDNKSGYRNEFVDQQLEKLVQNNLNDEQREELIFNIVRQLENDVAILPLFQYQRRVAIDSDIRGIELNNSSEVIYSKDLYRQ